MGASSPALAWGGGGQGRVFLSHAGGEEAAAQRLAFEFMTVDHLAAQQRETEHAAEEQGGDDDRFKVHGVTSGRADAPDCTRRA